MQSHILLLTTLFTLVLSFPLHRRQSLATVHTSCTVAKTAAITFDDGPYIYLQEISDLFTAANAKATFFFNGNNFDCIYDPAGIANVKYAYNAGHQIASHTWSHGDLTTFTADQINDGLFRMEEAFSRIVGVKPAFMRPPYGSYNNDVLNVIASRGQDVVMWDSDAGDADGNTTAQSEAVYTDLVNSKVSNMLVLNHETEQTTATTLIPFAISTLQKAGYKLVTLAECLGNTKAPYSQIGIPQVQNANWTCVGTPAPGAGCVGTQCETGVVNVVTSSPVSVSVPPVSSSAPPVSSSTPPVSVSTPPVSSSAPPASSSTPPASVSTPPVSSSVPPIVSSLPSSAPPIPVSTPPTITASPVPAPSGTSIHPSADSSKCLAASSNTNNAVVSIEPCSDNDASQLWTTTSSGALTIFGGSKCLDVTSGSAVNGNKMQIFACTSGNTNQQFTIASGEIQWKNKGFCLDNTGGLLTAGNPTQIWTCSAGNTNQKWSFSAIAHAQPPPTTSVTVSIPVSSPPASFVGKEVRPHASPSQCLTAQSDTDGASVVIEPCTSTSSQLWTQSPSGTLTIFSGTKCLDVPSGSLTLGTKLQIWTCTTGDTNQKFTAPAGGQLTWTGKNECVDLTDGSLAAGNKVQMWSCVNGNTNQLWSFA